jgi:holliday junction DNA helicase RuvA
MIGFLHGVLALKAPPQLVVDVGGVGYELEAPMSTFYGLPATGEKVRLLTHLVVREDAHILFGFLTDDERRLFRALLKVTGVGPKLALGVLSGITLEGFLACIEAEDTSTLVRIPGIGRKTAERIVIELRDRVKALGEGAAGAMLPGEGLSAAPVGAQAEAFSALVALGYKPPEVTKLLKQVAVEGASTEDLIRRALQQVASR